MTLDEFEKVDVHSLNPLLVTIDDFCTQEECQELRQCFETLGMLKASVGGSNAGGVRVDETQRSAKEAVPNEASDELLKPIIERVTSLLNFSPACSEVPAILRYTPGEQYARHFDAVNGGDDAGLLAGRVFTGVLYINDDFEGGETEFPAISKTIVPKAGRLAIWSNKRPNGSQRHRLSIHAGLPVLSDTKWIVTFWMHRPDGKLVQGAE